MNLQDAYYEAKFEVDFLRAKADAFQTLFERLMAYAFKADFMPCRPWGNRGDRKNDGFLKSERRLFQVYAPNEMTETEAIKKIKEDFGGAKKYWRVHFDKWVFLHNADGGLPPHVQKLILGLERRNPGVTLEPWCLEELRVIFRRLSPDDKASWYGPAPSEATRTRLGFSDVQVILESLVGKTPEPGGSVASVPPGKIESNDLSPSVATLIKGGMTKAPLVSEFLRNWHDHGLAERLAEAFRAEYARLRGTLHPNVIFSELQTWTGGSDRGTADHQMAVLAVVAYFFERCDIFEEPAALAT